MALARTGPLIGQIQGRIGGLQFNRRGGGISITKSRASSASATPDQLTARANLTRNHQIWQALGTDTQRKWSLWAAMHPIPNAVGTQRTRTGLQALSWWRPFGETGLSDGLTANYRGPDHALISPSPAPLNLVFSASGEAIVQTNVTIYPAYYQYLITWIALEGAVYHQSPRRWYSLGAIRMTDCDPHITAALAAASLALIPGQYAHIRCIHLIRGVPDYWPSETAYAYTTVFP